MCNVQFTLPDVPPTMIGLRCKHCGGQFEVEFRSAYWAKCPYCNPKKEEIMTDSYSDWCVRNGHPGATKDWEKEEQPKDMSAFVVENAEQEVKKILADEAEKILAENKSARMNAGKPPLHYLMLFPTAIEAFARVCEGGANKYDYGNFLKGGKHWSEAIDCCMRHILKYARARIYQELDIDIGGDGPISLFSEDMGCHHLAHAMWNLMFELDMNNKGQTHDPVHFAKMAEFWKSVKGLPLDEICGKLEVYLEQTDKELAA